MRTLAIALLLSVDSMASDDTKALQDHLQRSSEAFEKAVAGLTEAQWTLKPAPDRWSIAECAEHIAATEDALRGLIEKGVLTKPPKPEGTVGDAGQDAKVLKFITSREGKAKAPEMLQPKNSFGSLQGAVAHFRESRAKSVKLTERNDLRRYSMPNQLLGEMDAHQWMLYLSGHVLRHVAQMEEVKASAGYPR